MPVKFRKSDFEEMRRHGEETYPRESCGVLVGEAGPTRTVFAVVRCRNTRTESLHTRYQIDPRELIRIQRECHLAAQSIVGFYHSHPDHPAHWSTTDLDEAYWVNCSYVITSVEKGKAAHTRSFLLLGEDAAKRFEDEEVVITA